MKDFQKVLRLDRNVVPALASHGARISATVGWLFRRGVYQQALNLLNESGRNLRDNPQMRTISA